MDRHRLVPALLVAGVLGLVAAQGCGGGSADSADGGGGSTTPTLPFPPQAYEPAEAPPTDGTPAGTIVRTGGRAEGVAVDPQTGIAAVGVKGAQTSDDYLALVDVRAGRLVRRVDIPSAPRHVELAEPGGPFLVPAEDANELALVNPMSGQTQTTKVGDHPHDATYLGGSFYTANEFAGTVTEVRNARAVRTGVVDVQPGGIRAVGDKIAVVSVRANTIELLDSDTLAQGGSQNVGYGPSHVVVGPQNRLYVADTRGGGISVFETEPELKFVARLAIPDSPYGLAMDEQRQTMWVTRTGANQVAQVDISGDEPRVVRNIPTIRQPNTVGVDESSGRLVIASATEGAVQLLDP